MYFQLLFKKINGIYEKNGLYKNKCGNLNYSKVIYFILNLIGC